VRNVTVLAVLVFGMAGIVMADTPPSLPMPPSGHNALSANYRPQVSPDIAALQAQERAALADGTRPLLANSRNRSKRYSSSSRTSCRANAHRRAAGSRHAPGSTSRPTI